MTKKWTYSYRGKPVTLWRLANDTWSLRVEAAPRLGLRRVSKSVAKKRVVELGLLATVPAPTRLRKATESPMRTVDYPASILVTARRTAPPKTGRIGRLDVDWYATTDYRAYCDSVGCDYRIGRDAAGAGVFNGRLPSHK